MTTQPGDEADVSTQPGEYADEASYTDTSTPPVADDMTNGGGEVAAAPAELAAPLGPLDALAFTQLVCDSVHGALVQLEAACTQMDGRPSELAHVKQSLRSLLGAAHRHGESLRHTDGLPPDRTRTGTSALRPPTTSRPAEGEAASTEAATAEIISAVAPTTAPTTPTASVRARSVESPPTPSYGATDIGASRLQARWLNLNLNRLSLNLPSPEP